MTRFTKLLTFVQQLPAFQILRANCSSLCWLSLTIERSLNWADSLKISEMEKWVHSPFIRMKSLIATLFYWNVIFYFESKSSSYYDLYTSISAYTYNFLEHVIIYNPGCMPRRFHLDIRVQFPTTRGQKTGVDQEKTVTLHPCSLLDAGTTVDGFFSSLGHQ